MAISLKDLSSDPTIAPPRLIVYGPHKIGKTTFGSTAPGAVVLPTEEGIGLLKVPHFPLLKTYDAVLEAIGALYNEEHSYQTAVLDTADWLEPLVWARTCRKHEWDHIERPGYGKGYVAAAEFWREILDGLNALRSHRDMCVVVLAHAEIKRFDAPETEPYDRYQIKLQHRAAALVEEWSDAILFANYRTFTQQTDVGFNKKVTRGIGTGERLIFTEERPAFKAGNRYSLPAELPFTWQAFQDALANTTSAEAA